MQRIDVQRLADRAGMKLTDLAKELFPKNKYPKMAIDRIVSGESSLNEEQISKLASMLNTSIAGLYSSTYWAQKYENGVHVFSRENYRAELNTNTNTTKIYHRDTLYHEDIIHADNISVSAYLAMLDSYIDQIEQK
jgi:hypothetical protein